eukprot:m.168205 g.168205  ORF g.168205 m.168205 type:complete len:377 (+) comp31504_c0_seq1:157-1287(+)
MSLIELASDKVGGKILFATDEWFAPAPMMINFEDPVWKEEVYTVQGKWMDGWESRRKRIEGHDWTILKLGIPGIIHEITIDTAFFTGNYSPQTSILATDANIEELLPKFSSEIGTAATPQEIVAAQKACDAVKWTEVVGMTKLKPGYPETRLQTFKVDPTQRFTYLRVNMFPDGGIARVRVYGECVRDWKAHYDTEKVVDLASVLNGATAIAWSDTHFGHPSRLLNPGRGVNMGDGWETARRLDRPAVLVKGSDGNLQVPGFEWCVIKLGTPGVVKNVEVDTAFFKGNFPESFRLEGCSTTKTIAPLSTGKFSADAVEALGDWRDICVRTKLKADDVASWDVSPTDTFTHVRLSMFPDGGISRIRINGTPVNQSKL